MGEDQATRLRQLVGDKLPAAMADTANIIEQIATDDIVTDDSYLESVSDEELANEAVQEAAAWANPNRSAVKTEPKLTPTELSAELMVGFAVGSTSAKNSRSVGEGDLVAGEILREPSSNITDNNNDNIVNNEFTELAESATEAVMGVANTDNYGSNENNDVIAGDDDINSDDELVEYQDIPEAIYTENIEYNMQPDEVAAANEPKSQSEAQLSEPAVEEKEFFEDIFSEDKADKWLNVRVVAVTSGKGGVGKTNVTLNLAIALQNMGYRVLVIDADLGMANIDVLLGSTSNKHLLDLLKEDITLSDVVMRGAYGVNYIAGGSGIEKTLDYDRAEKLFLQRKLAGCVDIADIILVDTGAGLGRNVMDFILAADEVLLVTTPEPTSLTDAYAVMKAYSIYANHKNISLVVNRVYEQDESREVVAKLQNAANKFLKMPVGCLGYIYEDTNVSRAVRKQQPFVVAAPNSPATRCIEALAKSMLTGDEMKVKLGWKGFLQKIFKF